MVVQFQQAFDLVPEGRSAHVTVSRAKLFLMAGDAFFSLGQTDMAERHYRESLRLMAQQVSAESNLPLLARSIDLL